MRNSRYQTPRTGSVLIEFALIALILYFLLAAIIEFGRILYSAQAVQQAADVGARELARVPLPAAVTFDLVLNRPESDLDAGLQSLYPASTPAERQAMVEQIVEARRRVFDRRYLVIPLNDPELQGTYGGRLDLFFRDAPVINQQLWPLMIVDEPEVLGGDRVLRYPGALVPDPDTNSFSGFTVRVPLVNASGVVDIIDVVEEVIPMGSAEGPFSLLAPVPEWQRGLVALRVNYPYQAAAMVSYPEDPASRFDPSPTNNMLNPNPVLDDDGRIGPNAGTLGLGRLEAVGQQVRPYRKVLTSQAMARRELFQIATP